MPQEAHMPSILPVDDEPQIASSLRRLFKREGFDVETATRGAEALSKLQTFAADVVLSDFRMPEMTGAELLAQVKRLHPQALRVILSGYADLDSVVTSVNEGEICHFLTKPWDDAALVAKVRALLAGRALLSDLFRPLASAPGFEEARMVHHESTVELRANLSRGEVTAREVSEMVARFGGIIEQAHLSMVGGLLERQGGKITVVAEVGGTRHLSVEIPLQSRAAMEAIESATAGHPAR
jgi:response regulator RpfG family c-di-GMP phosphodiesterase